MDCSGDWWPSQRPDNVRRMASSATTVAWDRGVTTHLEMHNFSKLGFITAQKDARETSCSPRTSGHRATSSYEERYATRRRRPRQWRRSRRQRLCHPLGSGRRGSRSRRRFLTVSHRGDAEPSVRRCWRHSEWKLVWIAGGWHPRPALWWTALSDTPTQYSTRMAGGSTGIRPCAVRSGATGRALAFTQSRPTSGARSGGPRSIPRRPVRAHKMDHCGDWSQCDASIRTLSKATLASTGGGYCLDRERWRRTTQYSGRGIRRSSAVRVVVCGNDPEWREGGGVLYRRRPVAARQGKLAEFLFDHLAAVR